MPRADNSPSVVLRFEEDERSADEIAEAALRGSASGLPRDQARVDAVAAESPSVPPCGIRPELKNWSPRAVATELGPKT